MIWISACVLGLIFVALILLSFLLEWGREQHWRGCTSLTRTQTSIPILFACAIALVSVLELVCMYSTISSLMKSARVTPHGSDDMVVTDEHEMLEAPRRQPNGNPVFTIDDGSDGDEEEGDSELSAVDEDEDEERPSGGTLPNGTTLHRVRKPTTAPDVDDKTGGL